eukprot:5745752-Pleurochrysis_carterae.AAC.1
MRARGAPPHAQSVRMAISPPISPVVAAQRDLASWRGQAQHPDMQGCTEKQGNLRRTRAGERVEGRGAGIKSRSCVWKTSAGGRARARAKVGARARAKVT